MTRNKISALGIFLAFLSSTPGWASLSANDVVVVYNSHPSWNTGNRQSQAVADYYCDLRGIPPANKVPISWYTPLDEEIIRNPADFYDQIQTPIANALSHRTEDGQVPNLATDPTKAIVLCYGIPLKITGLGRGERRTQAVYRLRQRTRLLPVYG